MGMLKGSFSRSPIARLLAAVSAVAIGSLGLSGAVGAAPVAVHAPSVGAPDIRLTTTASANVLVGTPATYALVATNPGAASSPAYNMSFRAVLPQGVSYVAGSVSPGSAGAPTQYVDPVTGETTLVWVNVADIQPAGSYRLTFKALADPLGYPVGDAVSVLSAAYANSNPRTVAKFDAQGVVVDGSFTGSDFANPVQTNITAIRIDKAVATAEAELLRGVHDQTTIYTLTVTNNDFARTSFVTVTDLLPAGLEFLQCGGVDNSTSGEVEYPGAPRLTVVPVVTSDCLRPEAVETVVNPRGKPAGVYTQVTWALGNMKPGEVTVIKYRAGIPLFKNTMDFGGATPAPASLDQAANLDNNSGASTAETGTEPSYTNYSDVEGFYEGDVTDGTSPTVRDTDTQTVTSEDLRLLKSVSPTAFSAGGIATYTLTAQTSEYRRATNIVITDMVPDGLCPISATTNTSIDNASECASQPGHAPTGTNYASITPRADGTTNVVFTPISELLDNATAVVTFQAVMRQTYSGTGLAGQATVGGDGFTNNVALSGMSRPLTGTSPDPSPAVEVYDTSWARQTVSTAVIDKQISLPATSLDCSTATYFNPTTSPDTRPAYSVGDRICFKLRVTFPSAASTRDPVVTDVSPTDTRDEATSWAAGPSNTVPGGQIVFNEAAATAGTANPTWVLGSTTGSSKFIELGRIFEATFSVIVDAPSGGTTPDITGNLMKFRSTNTNGDALSLRDQVDFKIAPVPPLTLTKTGDKTSAVEGTVVQYSVLVKNSGTTAAETDIPVSNIVVWDRLPSGLTCSDVSVISGGGSCVPPAGSITFPAIQWTIAGPLAPGATAAALTYSLTFPMGVPAGATYTNTAGVRVYETDNNIGGTNEFFPKTNIDPTVPAAEQNAPRADDPHSVTVPAVAVVKTGTTSITELNNNTPNQATIGELVTYTVTSTVSADTNVYNGVLNDPVPTGMELIGSPTATFDGGALPGGAALTTPVVSGVTQIRLTLPTTFSAGATNHSFVVTFTARVTTAATNVAGVVRRNTASFTSKVAPGGASLPTKSSAYNVTVVEPSISIAKTNDQPKPIEPGEIATFTVTVTNKAGAAPGHDVWVVDEIPAEIDLVGTPDPSAGAVVVDGSRVRWNVGDLAPGSSATLTYRARLGQGAVGGAAYFNTAAVTSTTIDNGSGPACPIPQVTERCYSASAESSISAIGLGITKSVEPKVLGPGQVATFTIRMVDKANLTGYNATIIDTLPANFDRNSVDLVTTSCIFDDGSVCPVAPVRLQNTPQADGTTLIGWTFGQLSPEAQDRNLVFIYTARLDASSAVVAGDTRTNIAQLYWDRNPGTPPTSTTETFNFESDKVEAKVKIVEPSLTISKSNDNAHPGPGEFIGYTVTVRAANDADSGDAFDVRVTDQLPSEVRYVPDSANRGGVYDKADHSISWNLAGPVNPGDVLRLTYDGVLADSSRLHAGDSYVNLATLRSYDSAPSGGRRYTGSDDSSAVSPRFPATQIRKSAPDDTAHLGRPFAWRLDVTSTGAVKAERIDVTDLLPKGWRYDDGSAQVRVAGGDARQEDPRVNLSNNQQRLTWVDLANLLPGDALSIVFTATPLSSSLAENGVRPAPHVNLASATPEDGSGATGNGDGEYGGPEDAAAAFINSADLMITKTHTTDPVVAGQGMDFVLEVSNLGPDTAEGPITVDDAFPVGLTPTQAGGDGWSCSIVGRDVHCERENRDQNLASGDSFPSIEIAADVDAEVSTTLTNVASVSGKTYDPDPTNDSDSDRVTPEASADLAIQKTAVGTFLRGSEATFVLQVRNLGPSAAVAPTVTDKLPRGMAFVSGVGDGWACSAAGRVVTCTHAASLLPGDSSSFTLTVSISNAIAQIVINRSSVSSPTADPNPNNNTSNSTVDFLKPAQHYKAPKKVAPPKTIFPEKTVEQANVRVSGYCIDLMSGKTVRGDVRVCKVMGNTVIVDGSGWLIVVTVKAPPANGYPAYRHEFRYTV